MIENTIMTAARIWMPRIFYGTAWKKDRTEALVGAAIRRGFRGVDTACQPKHYHEAGVGAAVAACIASGLPRKDLFLQTKFTPVSGQDPTRMPYDSRANLADQVAQSFDVSLRNLQTHYVDSLVLHSPYPRDEQTFEVWGALEELIDRGSVRQLGISNCYSLDTLKTLYGGSRIKPAVVQNRFYAQTGYDRELRGFCREQGIVYQSFWTLTANRTLLATEAVRSLAIEYGRTPEQILFRYLTQMDIVPLTGTTSESHMGEDLAIFDFELSAAELKAVTALL